MSLKKSTIVEIALGALTLGGLLSFGLVTRQKHKEAEEISYSYLIPRILSVFFIFFASLLAVDVFGQGLEFAETVIAFLVHLIPAFILLITLLIAWKWEHVGGVIFILLGLVYLYLAVGRASPANLILLAGSLFLIGVLFLVGERRG